MRIKCIDEKGNYYPWMYRAYNAANGPDSPFHYEDPFKAFEKTYNGRFTYQWDGRVKEFYFNNDDDATMFMLRFR
jgi:hypothetical protein